MSLASSGEGRFVAVDERGDLCWTWHLSNPATPPEPRAVVTAVEILEPGTVAVGMADGVYSVDLDPIAGTANWLPALDGELVDFALTTVGGERAVLVATPTEHYLHTGPAPAVRLGWSDWAAARFEARQTDSVIRIGESLATVTYDLGILSLAVGANPASELGQHAGCRVVHCAAVGGRPTAFSGGWDGQVRIWDLLTGTQTASLDLNRPVWMIGTIRGTHLLVAAGDELVCFVHIDVNRVGREVTVEVLDVDMERERVSLSLKQANEGFTADTEFDPTQYGMAAEYDTEGNYIYPEGFDPDTQEWQEGFDKQREEWERQYAEAHTRYEQHMTQVKKAAEAEAAAESEGPVEGVEGVEREYSSAGSADKQKSGGTLASDEQLAALREKLSGGV